MFDVIITFEARAEFLTLPMGIQRRAQGIFERLVEWPAVSGVKPLKGELKGAYRIRTGDWRILFRVDEPRSQIIVFRLAHRREVYE